VNAGAPHLRVDDADPALIRRVTAIVAPICDYYFRNEVRGLDRVPDGPALLVGNHDGGNLPVDGICFAAAWHRYFDFQRPLRVLMHEIPFRLTRQLREFLLGIGCVSAAPSSFETVVRRGEVQLVYPGAAREAFRTYRDRRLIDLGGRTGFVARALRHRLPIVPVASVGAHETMFILRSGRRLARWMGIDKHFRADVWPLIAGIPLGLWLGPVFPHLPLPSKITLEVLPPIALAEELSERLGRRVTPDDALAPEVVRSGFELVREVLQAAVLRLYAARRFPVIG
jgi:1-acyl-sn-glycerol-3-phosphate acyltransferase